MTKQRFQNVNEALQSLSKVKGISVSSKVITLSKMSMVGINTWGTLDYLENYHKYVVKKENGALAR